MSTNRRNETFHVYSAACHNCFLLIPLALYANLCTVVELKNFDLLFYFVSTSSF